MSETKCKLIGHVKELSGHEYGKRVYSKEAASPAVVCGRGGLSGHKDNRGKLLEIQNTQTYV